MPQFIISNYRAMRRIVLLLILFPFVFACQKKTNLEDENETIVFSTEQLHGNLMGDNFRAEGGIAQTYFNNFELFVTGMDDCNSSTRVVRSRDHIYIKFSREVVDKLREDSSTLPWVFSTGGKEVVISLNKKVGGQFIISKAVGSVRINSFHNGKLNISVKAKAEKQGEVIGNIDGYIEVCE